MNKRRSILKSFLALAGVGSLNEAVAGEQGEEDGPTAAAVGLVGAGAGLPILYTARTMVVRFSPTTPPGTTITFAGDDFGWTDGGLTGALIQSFTVTVNPTTGAASTGPDHALFTDLERDQISWEYEGTGIFLPPSNLNKLQAAGGSLAVTYTVVDASGKYQFLIGRKFPANVVATNAANPSSGVMGPTYTEVYAHDAKSIIRTINRSF